MGVPDPNAPPHRGRSVQYKTRIHDRTYMTKGPEGCGVEEHPEHCLCDVVITTPTETKVGIPYGVPHGEGIAHYGKWDGTLEHWFQIASIAYDAIHKFHHPEPVKPDYDNNPSVATRFKRKLPDDVYDYIVEGIDRGIQPTALRNEIQEKFGVTIHKSYVSKLKHRLKERSNK